MDNEQMAAPLRNAETPDSNLGKSLKQKAKKLKAKCTNAKRKKLERQQAFSFQLLAIV